MKRLSWKKYMYFIIDEETYWTLMVLLKNLRTSYVHRTLLQRQRNLWLGSSLKTLTSFKKWQSIYISRWTNELTTELFDSETIYDNYTEAWNSDLLAKLKIIIVTVTVSWVRSGLQYSLSLIHILIFIRLLLLWHYFSQKTHIIRFCSCH